MFGEQTDCTVVPGDGDGGDGGGGGGGDGDGDDDDDDDNDHDDVFLATYNHSWRPTPSHIECVSVNSLGPCQL